ncbi:MAG: amidase family protein [Anaerorhabdus sp.]
MKIEEYAKKTFVAMKNPFQSICEVNALVLNKISDRVSTNGFAYYVGVKNTPTIPQSFLFNLENKGFLVHTRDVMAPGGRAIDVYLRNPITGHFMTGSSSGTALNVFYHINDLGIGTDGGGSVLAPAAALNLFGFISPLMAKNEMSLCKKLSTEGIEFSPSLGFITREWETMKRAIKSTISTDLVSNGIVLVSNGVKISNVITEEIAMIDLSEDRNKLIRFLKEHVDNEHFLLSIEGPVDIDGIGDSIFGHYDEKTKDCQKKCGKGLMRVVNICGYSAFTIPKKELGCSYVLIGESSESSIYTMMSIAEKLKIEQSDVVKKYFSNLDMYL